MSLILITAIFAVSWLLLALAGREVEKRWRAARIGSLIGKQALAAVLKTALTLSKVATLTYGTLLLLLYGLEWFGRHISPADYQAVLDRLSSVRSVLSFSSGGLGKACFTIVIVILAWRLYARYFQAISSETPQQEDPDAPPPSWLALLGQFLASKTFFKQSRILGKYSGNFATMVFCLSLVGAGGSAVNQEIKGSTTPSKNEVLEPGGLEANANPGQLPQQPAPQQSDVIDDKRFAEMIAHALVDAFAESPAWDDALRLDIPIDQQALARAIVPVAGNAPSVELVKGLMAKDPATFSFKEFDQNARRKVQAWLRQTTPQGTGDARKMVLDGMVGETFGEILPDPTDPIAGKVQKPVSKAAQGAVGTYLEMAVDSVAGKVKAGVRLDTAIWDLRTLHRQGLPESGLKEVASMFAEAEAEAARLKIVPPEKPLAPKVGNVAGAPETKVGVLPPSDDIFNPNLELHPKKPPVGPVKPPGLIGIGEEAGCWVVRLKIKRLHCP